ncbi:TasA family protein [Bacillus salipaludis]|uniref:TasA family protein n=1 Tax=Bacillus salipaludis TaxID=2547811 RepID=A0ABW8REQ4_9BACI
MKKWQKALIGSALAGTLVAGSGFGTYAWFTAEKKATGTIVNGTFSLGDMGQLFKHKNFAPSQLLYSDWNTVDNTGSMDQVLRATYTHKLDNANVNVNKYKVGYIALKYKEKPSGDVLKDSKYKLEALFNGTTNPLSMSKAESSNYEVETGILSDSEVQSLVEQQGDQSSKVIKIGDGNKFWKLKTDEYIDIIFGVKLSDKAGNEYQGVKYDAEFKVEAKQTDNGAEYQSE